jgi:hypothetical protein
VRHSPLVLRELIQTISGDEDISTERAVGLVAMVTVRNCNLCVCADAFAAVISCLPHRVH